MEICLVTPRYPPRTGGVETHVHELATGFADRSHAVTVVTADAETGLTERDERNGVTILRHRGFAPGGAFHVAPGVAATVRRLDADVVHAHNYHSLPLFFAALGVTDERFVATTHYHGESPSGLRNVLLRFYRPLGRWAVRRADARIAVSDWEARRLASDLGVDAVQIPNGIEVERFTDATPRDHGRPYLLCVGRLEEYKGVQHVIRAIPDIPEYDLLVAGSGAYRDNLESTAASVGVGDRVEFLGYVPDRQLPPLYAGADVYVSLSEFEAFGLTVGEALASGTPCVLRDAGALSDWCDRDDCICVSDASSENVAKAVRRASGRSASPEGLYDWDDVVESVLDEYRGQ
jgi:glycosyltransferase involved in cell wall biosynthesis